MTNTEYYTNGPRHATFRTRDYYLAAYLHLYHLDLLTVRIVDTPRGRKPEFEFDNSDDQAFTRSRDLHQGDGSDLVSLSAFRDAYKVIQAAATHERETQYADTLNNNND